MLNHDKSFSGNEGLRIITAIEKKRLTKEEAMVRFRKRYPISPKKITPDPQLAIIQKKGAIEEKGLQQQLVEEAHESVSNTQRSRGLHAGCPSNAATQVDDVRAEIERRIQFEKVGSAELERMMAFSDGYWYLHLSEKVTSSRGKIQAYQGVLNALLV